MRMYSAFLDLSGMSWVNGFAQIKAFMSPFAEQNKFENCEKRQENASLYYISNINASNFSVQEITFTQPYLILQTSTLVFRSAFIVKILFIFTLYLSQFEFLDYNLQLRLLCRVAQQL